MKIQVINGYGEKEPFKPRKIKQQIIEETKCDEDLAQRIQDRVSSKFYKLGVEEISTRQIRAEVSYHLLKEGMVDDAENTLKMGMSISQIEALLENHSTENANNNDNSESFYKRIAEGTLEEYTLAKLPKDISQAHTNCYIHIHDRNDFFIKPNCVSGNNNVIVKDKDNIVSYIRMDDLVSEFEINDDFYYEVPTLNIEKNIVEWKPIINAWCTGEDDIYRATFGKGYSIECTNDHKFIKSSRNKPCNDYDVTLGEFMEYKDLRLCNITDIYEGNDMNDYEWSALFGFFLGDGHLEKRTHNIRFSFTKEDKVEYLVSLLERMGVSYYNNIRQSSHYTGGLRYDVVITDELYPIMSKSDLIRRFKTKLNLKGTLEGLIASDGGLRLDVNNALKLYFSNTNKDIFDLYQLCLLSQGIRGGTHHKQPIGYYDIINRCERISQQEVYMSSSFGENVIKLVNDITLRENHRLAMQGYNTNPKKYSIISELRPKSIEYIGKGKVYNLTIKDNHNYMCGIDGFILVQNCFSYSIPWLLQNGFSPDGDRQLGATSSPPKHFDTLMNLMHELLGCGKIDLSGGQNFPHANVYLAPCSVNLSYDELKQNLQSLLFNLNQAIMSKGEVVFSSMGWDLEIPSYMKDEDAIGLGGVVVGKYKDYEDEAKRILKIWCELLQEGDSRGVPFRFPNNIFTLRDDYENSIDEQLYWICEYLCKFPTGYFSNDDLPNTGGISTIMGCVDGNTEIWCKINNKIQLMTFEEISELIGADYGVTPIDNIEVLTIGDDKKVVWAKARNFIKNPKQQLYKIKLKGNKSFICDEQHNMITFTGLNEKPILECDGSRLIDVSCKDTLVDFDVDYNALIYGFWLGDGNKTIDNGLISVSKSDKKEYLEKAFSKAQIPYELNHKVREIDDRHKNPHIWEFIFDKSCFIELNLEDENVLGGLLSGMLSSDGYLRFNGKYKSTLCAEYVSTDKHITDLFKYCCFMLGIKFSSKQFKRAKQNHKDFERVYLSCNESTIHSLKQLDLRKQQSELLETLTSDMYRPIKSYKQQMIKSIDLLDKQDTYCFEVNGRMIIGSDFILTGNCRTRNTNADPRWSWQDNTLNNGNLAFHSLNLPLFALESENIDEFYELLTKYCNIALDGLCLRRRVIEDRLANDKLPFLMWHDKKSGRTLYEVERTTLSVGYVGLDETVKELTNGEDDITTDKGRQLGIDIINHIQKLCNARKQETGYKIGVFSTPAESTAHRFAKHNKKKYPKAYINGKGNDIFYTNSHHIQVAKDVLLTDHLRNAETFHKLTPFGAICHVFLGTKPTVESLVKLTKLIKKHDIGFWSYTLDFTICNNCQQTFLQALDECPNCGSTTNLTVYSKITGYYVPVYKIDENGVKQRQWNDGKVGEFQERKRYSL